MVASIGAVAAPSQGVSYYERDGYYAKDDPDHRNASAWAGKGADALGLSGPVDPDVFTAILHAGRWKSTAMVSRYGARLLARQSGAARLARLQGRA